MARCVCVNSAVSSSQTKMGWVRVATESPVDKNWRVKSRSLKAIPTLTFQAQASAFTLCCAK